MFNVIIRLVFLMSYNTISLSYFYVACDFGVESLSQIGDARLRFVGSRVYQESRFGVRYLNLKAPRTQGSGFRV